MAAGIIRGEDRGLVGFVPVFGHTWHGYPEYVELDGEVPREDARKLLDYQVEKVPLVLNVSDDMATQFPSLKNGADANMCALVRTDTGRILHEVSVSPTFGVYQNVDFMDRLNKGLFAKYPTLAVESVGTLWGGQIAFINILLNKYRVKGDESETIDRLMFYNTFGGRSDSACVHGTRIVCWNTLNKATLQGQLNKTLRKFRHTSGIVERVDQYLIDLTELQAAIQQYNETLETLVDMPMTVKDVENFLGNLFPLKAAEGKKATKSMVTGRTNKQQAIRTIFETAPDLQGKIARTRYAMLQAVTNWSQHTLPEESETVDAAFAWFDVATGGTRDGRNQQALDILMNDVIPDAPVVASMN